VVGVVGRFYIEGLRSKPSDRFQKEKRETERKRKKEKEMREGEEKRGKEMREGREEATHSFRGKIEWPFVQPSTHPTSFFRLNTLKMNKTV
jgi:hypothetical protein